MSNFIIQGGKSLSGSIKVAGFKNAATPIIAASLLSKEEITLHNVPLIEDVKKMIQIFAEYYPHDFPEPEAIVVAGRYDARIKEIPVKMRKRVAGSSSIRYLKTLHYMVKVTFAILLDKLKERKDIV